MFNTPSTLTFLFTDIEGSTLLWERYPDAMKSALARHDDLLREAVTVHGGRVIKTTGDGLHAVFASTSDAVLGVLAAQRALANEQWGEVGRIGVRMGLHSGAAEAREGDYFGATLNRAARLMSIASGGQILLSEAAAGLVRDVLPPDASLRDLGEHRLKDLKRAERVYQLLASDLRADFPPLRSLESFPNNLPVQLTSFVGREKELADSRRLLGTTHLLTLTGPGGTGKTRLSLQLAADVLELFADGVWLIELAPLADPSLIVQTIANVLAVREQPTRSLIAVLRDFLRDKCLLLILDNCEHLIEACAQLADEVLHASSQLRIVASSREPLGIAGESIYRVPPLSVPVLSPESRVLSDKSEDAASSDTAQGRLSIQEFESVRLFVERAQAARADFALSDANAHAIAQICARLDGIPLAIELAAARVKSLSVEEIAARLDNQFRLLTGGSRTALPRQQTLRALIDWSYNLLTEPECVLFRRLAVFAGGWTLEAAEQVASDDVRPTMDEIDSHPPSAVLRPDDVLDLLDSLVNKSLVIAEPRDGGTRFRFLETIRQYARDKLLESGESERVRDRHLDYIERFARAVDLNLRTGDVRTWSDSAEREQDNLRTALEWSLARQPLAALRILGSVAMLWNNWGEFTEGQRWCEQALARTQTATGTEFSSARAQVLAALAQLTMARGDIETARQAIEASLRLYRELGRPAAMAQAFSVRVLIAYFRGERDAATAYFDEGLALARAANDKYAEMMLLGAMTSVAASRGEFAAAETYTEQAASIAREIGSQLGLGMAMMSGGMLAFVRGDYRLGRARLEESHADFQHMGQQHFANITRSELAHVARLLGEDERAVQLYREVIRVWKHEGHRAGIARCFECLAFIAGGHGKSTYAARLFGAAESLRELAHAAMMPGEQAEYAQQVQQIRSGADDATFANAWSEGRALTLEQAIQLAMSDE